MTNVYGAGACWCPQAGRRQRGFSSSTAIQTLTVRARSIPRNGYRRQGFEGGVHDAIECGAGMICCMEMLGAASGSRHLGRAMRRLRCLFTCHVTCMSLTTSNFRRAYNQMFVTDAILSDSDCFQQIPAVTRKPLQAPINGEGNVGSIWKQRPLSANRHQAKALTALCSCEYTLYLMCVFDHNAIALHLYYVFMSCTSSIVER